MDLVIPTKKFHSSDDAVSSPPFDGIFNTSEFVQKAKVTNDFLLNSLKVHDDIRSVVTKQFTTIDEATIKSVQNSLVSNRSKKESHASELNKQYMLLLTEVKKCIDSDNHNLKIQIVGNFSSCYQKPRLEYWNECNPIKALAIELFMNNLREKGWSPINKGINDYSVDHDDGMYYDGNVVTIECQFD